MSQRIRLRHVPRRWDMHFGPNTTPMADVILVMLIFFMASVALVGPKMFLTTSLAGAQVDSSIARTSAFELPPAMFRVRLMMQGDEVIVAGLGAGECSMDEARSRLSAMTGGQQSTDIIITVAPNADVPMQAVVAMQEACRLAGISRTALAPIEPGP